VSNKPQDGLPVGIPARTVAMNQTDQTALGPSARLTHQPHPDQTNQPNPKPKQPPKLVQPNPPQS